MGTLQPLYRASLLAGLALASGSHALHAQPQSVGMDLAAMRQEAVVTGKVAQQPSLFLLATPARENKQSQHGGVPSEEGAVSDPEITGGQPSAPYVKPAPQQPSEGADVKAEDSTPPKSAAEQMEVLYGQLASASTPPKASAIAKTIEAQWQHQGGAAVHLLSDRALFFARQGDLEKAITLMDQVVLVQPNYAEGWRRRAQLFLQRSSTQRAMYDLRETLRKEPRHYQAWAALGTILETNGDSFQALAAYRRALGIYPLMPDLKERVDRLYAVVRGYSL